VVQAVSVMAAQGEPTLVLATGGRTEKAAMRMLPDLPEVCFVEVGDFTGRRCGRRSRTGWRTWSSSAWPASSPSSPAACS
jgi:cobalt-precorrin-5B (C1)-methyltransferase